MPTFGTWLGQWEGGPGGGVGGGGLIAPPPDPFIISSFNQSSDYYYAGRTSPPVVRTLTASRVLYVPFEVHDATPFVVQVVSWANGTLLGNLDMGVYGLAAGTQTAPGARLFSIGSTAQAGAGGTQRVTGLSWSLTAGTYFMAFVPDSASQYVSGAVGNGVQVSALAAQAATFPLPANATPVEASVSEFIPALALSRLATLL